MKQILKMKRGDVLLWAVLFLGLTASFLFFYYGDLGNTLENAVLLVDAIRDGELLSYYDYTIKNVTSYWAANYDLPIYIIFAIWNIPVIFARWVLGLSVTSGWALLWCKGLVVVAIMGCVRIFYQICGELEMKRESKLWGCFLMLSSLHVVAPVFILGQYDCIALFFMLLGIYYYIKGSSKLFFVCFMAAIPLKMFALFLLIPLILLKEKRIFAALFKIALTCIPWFVFRLISGVDTAYEFAVGAQSRDGLNKLLKESEGFAGQPVCIFLGIWLVICLYCYLHKMMKEDKFLPIYVCFLTFMSMMMFLAISDYWIVLVVPFVIFIILYHPENIKINILLETVGSCCYLLFTFIAKLYPYNYPDLTKKLVLPHFINTPVAENARYGNVLGLLQELGMDKFAYAFYTVFFICMIAIVVINRPGKTAGEEVADNRELRQMMWVRIIAIIGILGMLLLANLSAGNYPAFSTVGYKYANVGKNLIDGNVIEQKITFADDRSLQELQLYFINTSDRRENMSSVYVELVEEDSGEILFSKRIGSNMIQSEKAYKIKLKHIEVEAGESYYIRITGEEGVKGHQNYISPVSVKEYDGELENLLINGTIESSPLYFEIR